MRTLSCTRSLTASISAASWRGRRSTVLAPGSATTFSMRTRSALSLHTSARVRRSTSSGAVQRPRYPGLPASYTSLPGLGFRV